MKTVKVKNITIGADIPKICVPIVATTELAILEEAKNLSSIKLDIVEWRVDYFDYADDLVKVKNILAALVNILTDIPILFTFRTQKEGGQRHISITNYIELNKEIASTGLVDLIDIEVFTVYESVTDIIQTAHKHNVNIILSSHDFEKTPPKDDMIYRLRKMQNLGADIVKIAVMPQSKLDVLELLETTAIMSENYSNTPIVAISMGTLGLITRLSSEIFGSAITFGATKNTSAPGQINANDLNNIVNIIHSNM